MVSFVLIPTSLLCLSLFSLIDLKEDISSEKRDKLFMTLFTIYIVLLSIFLSVFNVLADEKKPRVVGPIEQQVFGASAGDFPEKGKLYIGDKVILKKGFEQDIHIPEGGSMAIVSAKFNRGYVDFTTPDKEKGTSYTIRKFSIRVSYLVVSPTQIQIDTLAKDKEVFLYDGQGNPILFQQGKTRLQMPSEINGESQGAYAFASSASTRFHKTYYGEWAFVLDNFERLEPDARWHDVRMPMPSDTNQFFGNKEFLKSGNYYEYEIDYQYNAKFVAGRNGQVMPNAKDLFSVEVDKIEQEEAKKEQHAKEKSDGTEKDSKKVNADNSGKKDESDKIENPWDGLKFLAKVLVYDEDEVKKAIISSMEKMKFMKQGTRVNGSTDNPAALASDEIFKGMARDLDRAESNVGIIEGANLEAYKGRGDWRYLVKFCMRMFISFVILGYIMKVKERIAAK
jgi:hypothetical protein